MREHKLPDCYGYHKSYFSKSAFLCVKPLRQCLFSTSLTCISSAWIAQALTKYRLHNESLQKYCAVQCSFPFPTHRIYLGCTAQVSTYLATHWASFIHFFFHPTETLPSHYFKTKLSSAVPVSCLHTRWLSSPTSSFPPSPTAHTYLLQLLSPGVCFWWIGVFSNQFPQRALQLLHLSWVLGQFWQQGLQKKNNVCISKLFNKANKTWL